MNILEQILIRLLLEGTEALRTVLVSLPWKGKVDSLFFCRSYCGTKKVLSAKWLQYNLLLLNLRLT